MSPWGGCPNPLPNPTSQPSPAPSPPHTAPRICFIFSAGCESHVFCFNDMLSAIYWEIKGWYLQDLAQSGYNNISLPLMINCSTLKEEEERLFKREQACFVLWLSTVNISLWDLCWVRWMQPVVGRLYCLCHSDEQTHKQTNKQKKTWPLLLYVPVRHIAWKEINPQSRHAVKHVESKLLLHGGEIYDHQQFVYGGIYVKKKTSTASTPMALYLLSLESKRNSVTSWICSTTLKCRITFHWNHFF